MSNGKQVERRRRLVHFAFGGCAFLVEPLGRWPCVGLAAAALAYNAVVAPGFLLDASYRRAGEGRWGGLVTYPLAVLALLIAAPPVVAAAAWIVLAAADPAAAAAGSRFPEPPVPWNRKKSLVGLFAGFFAATVLAGLLLAHLEVPRAWSAAAAAGAAGAFAESLPLRIDDNLPIAAAAALALLLLVG